MPQGKDLIGSQVRYSTGAGGVDVVALGSNPRRVGLVISAPSAGTLSVRFGDAAGAAVDIIVTVNSLPWCVTIEDIGTLIQQSVHIFGSSAGAHGGIIETSTP